MKPLVVIPISGGMDSAYLMWKAIDEGYDTYPVIFDDHTSTYASKVVGPATGLVRMAGLHLRHKVLPLSLTNHERIHDKGFGFIPGRNMSMALVAVSYAHFLTVQEHPLRDVEVWFGFAASNEGFYPDQTFEMFNDLVNLYNRIYSTGIQIKLPIADLSRTDVIRKGHAIGVPLDKTVSCQRTPIAINCGTCPRCSERKKAFAWAGVEDKTMYLCS